MSSFQPGQHLEFHNPNLTVITYDRINNATSDSRQLVSRNNSSDNYDEKVLVRLSNVVKHDDLFFLDFPFFVISIENISSLLELPRPGPTAEIDFYHLYCRYIQGDKHVLRTIQSLCRHCYKPEIQEVMSVAVKLAPSRKQNKKLQKFYELYGLMDALHEPFICEEGIFRLVLLNIWKKDGKGKVTRKKMIKMYISYCQHILKLKEFFHGLIELAHLIPGPYKIEDLDQILIVVENVATDRFLSESDVFKLAHYVREYVGVDHRIFLQLPNIVRLISLSDPVKLGIIPKQLESTNGGGDEMKCQENLELCAISPSSVNMLDRVQLQFPSELTNADYIEIFNWTFLPSSEDAGIFFISNCQWNEFLVLEDHMQIPGLYRISTTKNYNNERSKFTMVLKQNSLQIVSNFALSPILINESAQVAYVKANGSMADGTYFSIKST